MTRTLRLSVSLGALLAAAVGCGGKTAINVDGGEGEGDAIAVMTGMGGKAGTGQGGGGGSVATTGSGGSTGNGSGGTSGTGSGGVGTTGAGGAGTGGATGTGGTNGTGGTTGTGGQAGVDAGIMMCVAGAVCPIVNARCTAPCGGGMVRICFCDPNSRVACQNCTPPPPPACAANVVTGRACNAAMNPPCGGCVNGQTSACTCTPAGMGRAAWNCVIPVPVQACQ